MMKKYIFLDIDNTLLDFNKCSKISIQEGFEKYGIIYHEDVFDIFVKINDSLWEQIEEGRLTKGKLYEIRWKAIFKALDINFDGQKFERYFVNSLNYIAKEVDGAYDLLRYLSNKYEVFLTSNAPYDQQWNRLKIADMLKYIKKIYASERIGYAKPSKRFFDYCIDDIGIVDKNEVMIIGDSYTADVQGGFNSQIDTIWFDRNKKEISDSLATYRISSLYEIMNIL